MAPAHRAQPAKLAERQELQDWLRRSRLEACTGLFEQASKQADAEWTALQGRLRLARGPGWIAWPNC